MFSGKTILAIDTSCDDTSAAIVTSDRNVLASIVSSQIDLHAIHGGVVPEVASRAHTESVSLVVDEALKSANLSLNEIEAIAVTNKPGLIGCLLSGVSFAKGLAYRLNCPLFSVDHLQGHLFSPFLEKDVVYPFLGLVVSGGHTAFYRVESAESIQLIGQTVDDAVGEAFDKIAKVMGLGYPGGPVVDRLAQKGRDQVYEFSLPRVKMGEQYLSFSGLKTAAFLKWQSIENPTEPEKNDFCASVQKILIQSLIQKTNYFLNQNSYHAVALSGGVAMNSRLRHDLSELCSQKDQILHLAKPLYCCDNAAMIGQIPFLKSLSDERETIKVQASQKIQARKLTK